MMKSVDVIHQGEIVLDSERFRRQLRELLLRPEELGIGSLRRRETIFGEEWIIQKWESTSTPPDGAKFPIFHRFAVLGVSNDPSVRSERWISSIKPRSGQTLIAILVHPQKIHELDISVWIHGHVTKPTCLHFVGRRMDSIVRSDSINQEESNETNSEIEWLRASRTDGALGRELAPRCRKLRMLVGGAGSGGSEVVRQFASLMPEHITVVDGDLVGIENLNALPHATLRDAELCRPKVNALLRSVHRNQPDLSMTGIRNRLQAAQTIRHLTRMPRYSGIVTFVDNEGARAAAAMLAQQLYVPHLDIGTLIQTGEQRVDIRLFTPGGGGCVACVPKSPDVAAMLYEARSPANVLHPGNSPQTWNHRRDGSLLSLNTWAVSESVRLWLRFMKGSVQSSWIRVFSVDGSPLEWLEEPVSGDPECPICATATI